jgi:hypothetical protein
MLKRKEENHSAELARVRTEAVTAKTKAAKSFEGALSKATCRDRCSQRGV